MLSDIDSIYSTTFPPYIARKIYAELLAFEDGTNESWTCVAGYRKGENEGTT